MIPEFFGLLNRCHWFRGYQLPSGINLLHKLSEFLRFALILQLNASKVH